jgi:hypothetical protein
LQEDESKEEEQTVVETSSLPSEGTRISSFLDRETRRREAAAAEMARLEEAEQNVSEEELERRSLGKDERETYRVLTKKMHMSHAAAMDEIQRRREEPEEW